MAWTTTVASLVAVVLRRRRSRACCWATATPLLVDCALLGLWAFTNLEIAYAQLRVEERARTYVFASGANVLMTVTFTVALVVFAGQGARGLLLGNFGASAIVVLGLWWVLRDRFSLRPRAADLRAMLRFGLPTVPADASVYALQVADRFYLFREDSHRGGGALRLRDPLATVVFVAVRGFQYAWPPLAYSVESDEEAGQAVLPGHDVLRAGDGRRGVRGRAAGALARAPARGRRATSARYSALPWLALGWALYGLYLVFLAISARARVTTRNFPRRPAGWR